MRTLKVEVLDKITSLKGEPWWVWPAMLATVFNCIFGLLVWPMLGYFPVGVFPLLLTGFAAWTKSENSDRKNLRFPNIRTLAIAVYEAWLIIGGILLLVWMFSGSGWPQIGM